MYCKNCGAKLNDNEKFCQNCGAPTGNAAKPEAPVCPVCGQRINPGEKFCQNCGTPTGNAAKPPQPIAASSGAQFEFPKPISPEPAEAPAQQNALPIAQQPQKAQRAYKPKKQRLSGKAKLAIAITSVVLVLAVLAGVLIKSGVLSMLFAGKRETAKLSPDATVVTTKSGVTVDVGPCMLDDEAVLSVQKQKEEVNKEEGYKIVPYDISIGDMKQLDDFITIRIPYDTDFCDEGEDPARCVGAKYKNEETGEWEDTLFEVDSEKNELVIYTDHLSTYGAFHIANAKTAGARITYIDADMLSIDIEQAQEALQEFIDIKGIGDIQVNLAMVIMESAGFLRAMAEDAGSSITGYLDPVSNAFNVLTLADPVFDSKLGKEAYDFLGDVGKYASAVKLGAVMLKSDKTTAEALGIYKDAANLAASFSSSKIVGLSMSGIYVFDYVITTMFEQGQSIRETKINNLYRFYNNSYTDHARSIGGWYKIFKKIVDENPDPDIIAEEVKKEIDNYCKDFWKHEEQWPEAMAEMENRGNIGGSQIPPQPTAAEIEKLTASYKKELYDNTLDQVFNRLKYYEQERVRSEYIKAVNRLKAFYNLKISFIYEELLESGEQPVYAGYTMRFEPLPEDITEAEAASWTVKLGDKGAAGKLNIRLIAFITAGMPNRLAFYKPGDKPGKDEPEAAVPFMLSAPETKVEIGGSVSYDEILGAYSGDIVFKQVHIADPVYIFYHSLSSSSGNEAPPEPDNGDYDFFADLELAFGEAVNSVLDMSQAECDDLIAESVMESIDENGPIVFSDFVIKENNRENGTCYVEVNAGRDSQTLPLFCKGIFSGNTLTLNSLRGGDVIVCQLTFTKNPDGSISVTGSDVPFCIYVAFSDGIPNINIPITSVSDLNGECMEYVYFNADINLIKE